MTRMWLLPTHWLCRAHALGEHKELHQLVGQINKGMKLTKYVDYGLVDLTKIKERHEQLVVEFKERGWKHHSPLKAFSLALYPEKGSVDLHDNVGDLMDRCEQCKERIQQAYERGETL